MAERPGAMVLSVCALLRAPSGWEVLSSSRPTSTEARGHQAGDDLSLIWLVFEWGAARGRPLMEKRGAGSCCGTAAVSGLTGPRWRPAGTRAGARLPRGGIRRVSALRGTLSPPSPSSFPRFSLVLVLCFPPLSPWTHTVAWRLPAACWWSRPMAGRQAKAGLCSSTAAGDRWLLLEFPAGRGALRVLSLCGGVTAGGERWLLPEFPAGRGALRVLSLGDDDNDERQPREVGCLRQPREVGRSVRVAAPATQKWTARQ